MKSFIKVAGWVVLCGLLILSGVALVFVANSVSQQEPTDSTEAKDTLERVRVAVATEEDHQYLKGLGIDCPLGQMCEVTIPQWQRKELEKRKGIKVKVIPPPKPTPTPEKPKQVEYKLVKEIDLKADGVESIVFGPKKDKTSALSEIILGVKDEDICVYDSNFTLISKMYLYRLSFSKNLRYLGGIQYVKIPQDVTEKGSYKFELFDYTGKKLWELERELYYDASPNGYSISSNGTVVEGDWNGVLTFYDQKGNERKKVQLYRGTGDIGGQGMTGQFSEEGEYLLEIAHDDVDHVFGVGKGVMLFTSNAEELWRFAIEENGGGGLNISNHGNYMIVSSLVWPPPNYNYPPDRKSTYLLSKKGELIRKYENVLGSPICFSSNEKYALFDSYGTLFLIDLPSGEVILQYGRQGGFHQSNSLDIAEDAKIFGLASSSVVSLIGFDGSKMWSHAFPSEGGGVSLRLSDDGKQMIIATGPKIMVYQLVE